MQQSPKGTLRRWTPQEDFQIIYLMELGKDKSFIAKSLNRAEPATGSRVSILKNRGQLNRNLTFRTAPLPTPEATLTLVQASAALNISYFKARDLVVTGHLPAHKEPMMFGKADRWLVSESAVNQMKIDGVPKVSTTEPKVGDAKKKEPVQIPIKKEVKVEVKTKTNLNRVKSDFLSGMVQKVKTKLNEKSMSHETLASKAGVQPWSVEHDLEKTQKPAMSRLMKYFLVLGIKG